MMARPVIALVTDFGLRDHYVGAMKGVALGICPDVTFVDISHEIPAHDVLAGAVELDAAYRFFPPGTVFLVVVDPGVGSVRRGLAVDTGEYRFVAPDNGVLSLAIGRQLPLSAVELTQAAYARPTISRTFEGRDRFAPAAAWLATGVELLSLGPPVTAIHSLEAPLPRLARGEVIGEVLAVDRFGNLMTNIGRPLLAAFPSPLVIEIGGRRIKGLAGTYADVGPGTLCALMGSSDRLEIAVNGASASSTLAVGRGAPVRVGSGAW